MGYVISSFPTLDDVAVQVWFTNNNSHFSNLSFYRNLLSNEERARSEKFYQTLHQNNFIVTRALLRSLLSRQLNILPVEIEFFYNPQGKPFIKNKTDVQFNVSHTENYSAFAFVKKNTVGIDIEFKKTKLSIEGIAERFFSTREKKILENLTGEEKFNTFFQLWVGKEAFTKALGKSIFSQLANLEISFDAKVPYMSNCSDASVDLKKWRLHYFKLLPDLVGAVAIDNPDKKLEIRTFATEIENFQLIPFSAL